MCVIMQGEQITPITVDIFLQLLRTSGQKKDISIIRVFSKAVERIDFPGPELNSDLFPRIQSSSKCEKGHEPFSLHHQVRQKQPRIAEMERRFKDLDRGGKIPSFDDIQEYKNLVSSTQEEVLKSGVNIVLCTCNEAASHRITSTLEPKYCIIDECAMATEPECMVPIRRAEHVVLIGDHQQLQPVIQCKDAEKMGLGKSLFERLAQKGEKIKIHLLEIQYRMVHIMYKYGIMTIKQKSAYNYYLYIHAYTFKACLDYPFVSTCYLQHPMICEFPSQAFYRGRLKTDPSVERRAGLDLKGFWPQGERLPMVFCQMEGEEDSGHIGSGGGANVESKSKFNKDEAKKIVSNTQAQ